MIDEYWTWQFYGYHSDDLSYGSGKSIVAVCEGCGKHRILQMKLYNDFCMACAHTGEKNHNYGKHHTEERRRFQSEAMMGRNNPNYGKPRVHSEETKHKISKTLTGRKLEPLTDEHRQHISAGHQGIPYEEWMRFAGKERSYITPANRCLAVNEWFRESEAHHITPTIVAYIPSELHRHIHHNIQTGQNMGEMNILAIQFINGGLQITI